MTRSLYDARGLVPDPERLAEAHHVRRDPATDEVSWPPTRMDDVLRQLGLINQKDDDNA